MTRSDAKPVVRVVKRGERESLSFYTPEDIVPCPDERELKAQLDHYSRPFEGLNLPKDTPFHRRRYVEKVRPALRYFCKHFGHEIPKWLEGNGDYDRLSSDERKRLYGEEPLDVIEFERAESTKKSLDAVKEGADEEQKEHNISRKLALKLAKDHVKKDPRYYDKE